MGNPLIKEKMDLDVDVTKLKVSKSNFVSQQYHLEDNVRKIFPERIARTKQRIAGYEGDLAYLKTVPKEVESISPMTVMDKTYTDKEEAGKAILAACKQLKSKESLDIGSYKGFDMSISFDSFSKEFHLELNREMSYNVTLGTSEMGNITRIDNTLESIEKLLENSKAQLEAVTEQLETAKSELGKPFPQEAELSEKSARLAELNALLNMDGNEAENAALAAERKAQQSDIVADKPKTADKSEKIADKKPSILGRIKKLQAATKSEQKPTAKTKESEIQ